MKQDPKPKRQRAKRLEHDTKLRKRGGKEEANTAELSECADKTEEEETVMTVENCQRETESGGDDSWEDVTTSGNDSACEELSTHSNMDSTVATKSAELKSDMPGVVEKSEMIQSTEMKSGMFQSTEEGPIMIQKLPLLQNIEEKSEVLQNIEVKSGMDQDTEAESGNHQNMEGKSGTLQHTEVNMGKLQADGSSLNSESGNSTEISNVIRNSKVPSTIMQEVAQETLMSESTDCNELEDVSEIYFDKTHSDTLVETEEETINETMDLKEKENIPLTICVEKEMEGEIKTGSCNRHGHGEEQRKMDIIQNIGSGPLSDGVAAAAFVPEEK
jgi:hypothetical protein